MNSKILAILGGAGVLLMLGVAVRLLDRPSNGRSSGRSAPLERVERDERRDGAFGPRGQAAIVSINNSASEDDGRVRGIRPGRAGRVTTGTRTEDFDSMRERAMGRRDLSGMVRMRGGRWGAPVAGATIELYENDPDTKNPPLRTVETDAEGSFTITSINDQDMHYLAVARKEGFAPAVSRVLLSDNTPRLFLFMTTGTVTAGTVVDMETSQPLAGAAVTFPHPDGPMRMLGAALTDANGRFEFRDTPPGAVMVKASKDGYGDGSARGRSGGEDIVVRMAPGAGVVRGVGIGRATKAPSPGARIALIHSDGVRRSTLTDEEGAFEFRDVPPGDVRIVGTRRGIDSTIVERSLKRGEVIEGVEVVLPDDLLVQGRVIKFPTDVPFAGAKITYRGERGTESVISDRDGNFAFQTATLESYEIEIREKGWEAEILGNSGKKAGSEAGASVLAPVKLTRTLEDPAGASDRLVVRMKPTDSISGEVVMIDSTVLREDPFADVEEALTPVRNAQVTVDVRINGKMERVSTRTGANGEFFVNVAELGGERSGDSRVLASWRGMVGAANVPTNSNRPVQVRLSNSRLNARLELSDGTPLSDVRVEVRSFIRRGDPNSAENAGLPAAAVYTRRQGDFSLGIVANQPYSFKFEMPDGQFIEKSVARGEELMPRALFVYDPVINDIVVAKMEGRVRGERPGGAGGRGGESGDRVRRGGDGAAGEGRRGGQGGPGGPGGPGGWGGGRGGMVNP